MPSLPFKSSSKKDKKEVAEDAARKASSASKTASPPPAYSEATPIADDNVDITAAFAKLSLHNTPHDPDVDTCLAHLKLLFAFQSLKEDIGYTDGLWNIWDNRADGTDIDIEKDIESGALPPNEKRTTEDDRKIRLSKIREKRWALYVARAVDRYEAWWSTFPSDMLQEKDMALASGSLYHKFVEEPKYMEWNLTMLPPLDVLMV